uniref:Ribosomal protein S4 n=1 Tax=Brassica campestris TaxID=3711 RepID=A0A3P6DTA6_BRACM|nr:unnamed protein product [Brassica rapa]
MSPLRFQTCRLLSGNVRNRELTIIQRRILRRLRNRKRSIKKRKIYPKNILPVTYNYKLHESCPLFHGDLPITEMHRGTKRTSYIPFSTQSRNKIWTLFPSSPFFLKLFLKQGSR